MSVPWQDCLKAPRKVADAALEKVVREARAAGSDPLQVLRESNGWGFPEQVRSTFQTQQQQQQQQQGSSFSNSSQVG